MDSQGTGFPARAWSLNFGTQTTMDPTSDAPRHSAQESALGLSHLPPSPSSHEPPHMITKANDTASEDFLRLDGGSRSASEMRATTLHPSTPGSMTSPHELVNIDLVTPTRIEGLHHSIARAPVGPSLELGAGVEETRSDPRQSAQLGRPQQVPNVGSLERSLRRNTHEAWTPGNQESLAVAPGVRTETGRAGPSARTAAEADSPFSLSSSTSALGNEHGSSSHVYDDMVPTQDVVPSNAIPTFSISVKELPLGMREEDLLASFRYPPPWPNEHPFALAHAHARRIRGDAVSHDVRAGPAPFSSTRAARILPGPGAVGCFGIVQFGDENDCNRALIEMQGIVLTARESGDANPIRISTANTTLVPASTTSTRSSKEIESLSQSRQVPRVSLAKPAEHPNSIISVSAASNGHSGGPYATPSPAEIAMQSNTAPAPSPWGIPTLPGFPTVPATGASGPVDVGLHPGTTFSSSYGGPAALSGTGFFLGPSTLPSPSSALDPNNTTVFVGGLSSMISEEVLKTYFAPFGAIAYVKIPPGKGCGFVSFVQKVDAERAIEKMQGFPVGGCRIRLSWGRSQGEKHQHLAQQQFRQSFGYSGLQSPATGSHQSAQPLSPGDGPSQTTGHYALSGTPYQLQGGANPFFPHSSGEGVTQDFLSHLGDSANTNPVFDQLSGTGAPRPSSLQGWQHTYTAPITTVRSPPGQEISSPREHEIAAFLGRLELDPEPRTGSYAHTRVGLQDIAHSARGNEGQVSSRVTPGSPSRVQADFGGPVSPARALRQQTSMEMKHSPLASSMYSDRPGRSRTDTYPTWEEFGSAYQERPSSGFTSPESGSRYKFDSGTATDKRPYDGSTFAPFSPLVKSAVVAHSPNPSPEHEDVSGPQVLPNATSRTLGSSSADAQSMDGQPPSFDGAESTT